MAHAQHYQRPPAGARTIPSGLRQCPAPRITRVSGLYLHTYRTRSRPSPSMMRHPSGSDPSAASGKGRVSLIRLLTYQPERGLPRFSPHGKRVVGVRG